MYQCERVCGERAGVGGLVPAAADHHQYPYVQVKTMRGCRQPLDSKRPSATSHHTQHMPFQHAACDRVQHTAVAPRRRTTSIKVEVATTNNTARVTHTTAGSPPRGMVAAASNPANQVLIYM